MDITAYCFVLVLSSSLVYGQNEPKARLNSILAPDRTRKPLKQPKKITESLTILTWNYIASPGPSCRYLEAFKHQEPPAPVTNTN